MLLPDFFILSLGFWGVSNVKEKPNFTVTRKIRKIALLG